MVDTLESVELHIDSANIGASYGVTEPSLEEVFFKATSPDAAGIPKVEQSASDVIYEKPSRVTNYLQQVGGHFVKRFWCTVTSWQMFVYQILVPLMFIGLMFLIISAISGGTAETKQEIVVHVPFRENLWFVRGREDKGELSALVQSMVKHGIGRLQSSETSDDSNPAKIASNLLKSVSGPDANLESLAAYGSCPCTSHCGEDVRKNARAAPHTNIPGGDVLFGVNGVKNLMHWIVLANSTPDMVIGGFDNQLGPFFDIYAKSGFLPAVLNGLSNVLLRTGSKYEKPMEIRYSLEMIDLGYSSGFDYTKELTSIIGDLLQIFFIIFAFMTSTKGVAVFIMKEKESYLKRLQFLANASRVVYWMCNFVWDFFGFAVIASLILIILAAANNTFSQYVPYLLPVVFPYGMLMIAHIYFLSLFFGRASHLTTTIEVLGFVFLMGSVMLGVFENLAIFFLEPACHIFISSQGMYGEFGGFDRCVKETGVFGSSLKWWVPYINLLLRLHPLHLLVEGLTSVALMILCLKVYGSLMEKSSLVVENSSLAKKLDTLLKGSPLRYRYLGKYMFFGILGSVLFLGLTLWLEYRLPNGIQIRSWLKRRRQKKPMPVLLPTDPDVQNEEEKAMALAPGSQVPLVVKGLTKRFTSMERPAVQNVTFSITAPETFGLLGVNGAGKSTTFKMLSGFEIPDAGACEIGGHDVLRTPLKAEDNIMYCPQENILANGLTVRRHLDIFGRFLGIPAKARLEIVDRLINEVGLQDHETKDVGNLSGGNQRKVQLALALIGYSRVIFLDEPTTGMDPWARRLAWDAINRAVARGSTVVLTSHSMEECEVLCQRLVIMVAGRLQCIGSVQYLKNKLGNRYTFKIRLANPSQENSEGIQNEVFTAFGSDATLLDHHTTVICYEIDSAKLGHLSKLFNLLIQCQEKFHVQSFTVSQVTLEHVFVNMAKRAYEAEKEGHFEVTA